MCWIVGGGGTPEKLTRCRTAEHISPSHTCGDVAVLAGLVANTIADRYGYIGPFVFCLLPLTLVAILALAWWPENYGDPNSR